MQLAVIESLFLGLRNAFRDDENLSDVTREHMFNMVFVRVVEDMINNPDLEASEVRKLIIHALGKREI